MKVNDKPYAVNTDENGKMYADVPASLFADNNVAIANGIDTAFGQDKYLTHVDDENFVAASHKLFISGYDFTYNVEGAGTNDQKYTFDFVKNKKTVSLSGAVTYRMKVPAGLDINTLKVSTVNARGVEKEISFEKKGDLIEFSNTIKVFHFTSDPALLSISLAGSCKEVYKVGDTFDPTGLIVNANMSDGTTSELNSADYSISPVDMSTAGQKTVTVTYLGQSVTFTIMVEAKEEPGPGPSSSSNPDSSSTAPSSSSNPDSSSTAPNSSSSEPASSQPAPSSSSEPASSSSNGGTSVQVGCGGSIAVGSMTLAIAALGVLLVSLKKKHDDK